MPDFINQLIVNTPWEEPKKHWKFVETTRDFVLAEGRRPAGYVVASGTNDPNDPGTYVEIGLANHIRNKVNDWRTNDYPGITQITRELLSFWKNQDPDQPNKFFFCQIEAIETLIWLTEVEGYSSPDLMSILCNNESKKHSFIGDGGSFPRLCSKMATGTGKTVVMAMLVAWQTLNKIAYPNDARFSKYFFVVAPNLTVKERLDVLKPSSTSNYYDKFNIVQPIMRDRLNQAKVLVENWHKLSFEDDEKVSRKKGVDKRGAKSDLAFVREVLGDLSRTNGIVVINDEAHHAWRVPSNIKHPDKEAAEEATKWIDGLDRINKVIGIRACFDFSATPFWPSGKKSEEEYLFQWIVSDFGLNDAIESGLVKTPQVVVRDDSIQTKDSKSRLYHIYMDDEVKQDLNRKANENEQLPDLVSKAYNILGNDWRDTKKAWDKKHSETPPVMISVVNNTQTAARIKNAFDRKEGISIHELCDPEKTLRIDSELLRKAEDLDDGTSGTSANDTFDEDDAVPIKKSKKQQALELREKVNTVGKIGQLGEQIQNVISVGMLSEGWDTKTVTHIMGLRAFTSQLLCEQVVGRGLRRVTYDVDENGFLRPEYVNVFGVPFKFLPFESNGNSEEQAEPKTPPIRIAPDPNKIDKEIKWPNIVRINSYFRDKLSINHKDAKPFILNAFETPKLVDMGVFKDGRIDENELKTIDLKSLSDEYRLQKIVFEVAKKEYERYQEKEKPIATFADFVSLVNNYIKHGYVRILPVGLPEDLKRVTIAMNMSKLINHIWDEIEKSSSEKIEAVPDPSLPVKSTSMMFPWYTRREVVGDLKKNHINFSVYDSEWECSVGYELERNSLVDAWTKNDHLGFSIPYIHKGIYRSYFPDFLVRLTNGVNLIIEVKGEKTDKDDTKFAYLEQWCNGVTQSNFGKWVCYMCENPAEVPSLLKNLS